MHKLLDTPNIKLTTDLKEDPTISEFDIQATYISSQTYANKSSHLWKSSIEFYSS